MKVPREDCVSAVLIGGASRRMGVDKATLEIGGIALGYRVAEALGCNEGRTVVACGGRPEVARSLGLTHVPDDDPGAGPLVAVLTMLRTFPGSDVIVAACDLGGLDRATVRKFESSGLLTGHDVAVAFVETRQQSLMRWSASALPLVERLVVDGERSLRGAFGQLRVKDVAVEGPVMVNLNAPSDVELWQRS